MKEPIEKRIQTQARNLLMMHRVGTVLPDGTIVKGVVSVNDVQLMLEAMGKLVAQTMAAEYLPKAQEISEQAIRDVTAWLRQEKEKSGAGYPYHGHTDDWTGPVWADAIEDRFGIRQKDPAPLNLTFVVDPACPPDEIRMVDPKTGKITVTIKGVDPSSGS